MVHCLKYMCTQNSLASGSRMCRGKCSTCTYQKSTGISDWLLCLTQLFNKSCCWSKNEMLHFYCILTNNTHTQWCSDAEHKHFSSNSRKDVIAVIIRSLSHFKTMKWAKWPVKKAITSKGDDCSGSINQTHLSPKNTQLKRWSVSVLFFCAIS